MARRGDARGPHGACDHGPLHPRAWEDAARLLNADLGVFAAPLPDDDDGYAAGVRREHGHAGEDAFRAVRAALLEQVWASAQVRGRLCHDASPFAEDLPLRNIRRERGGLSGR